MNEFLDVSERIALNKMTLRKIEKENETAYRRKFKEIERLKIQITKDEKLLEEIKRRVGIE